MEIKIRAKDNVIILELVGRLDANAANLVENVGQCVHDGYTDILLNFDSIDFIDYFGLSALVLAYKEIINNKGRLKIANLPTHLRELFSVTGLDRVIEIHATEDLALNGFKEDKAIEDIKKMQLRRRFKRLFIDLKIEMIPKYASKPVCVNADILNLSGVGAYIYGCDQFKLGDELTLKLHLPEPSGEMELSAKVVWICDKQVQPQAYPGIGVEFVNISAQTQEKLVQFIEKNLSFSPTEGD